MLEKTSLNYLCGLEIVQIRVVRYVCSGFPRNYGKIHLRTLRPWVFFSVVNRYLSIHLNQKRFLWELGVGHLSIQNKAMICLSDHPQYLISGEFQMLKATFIELAKCIKQFSIPYCCCFVRKWFKHSNWIITDFVSNNAPRPATQI